MLNRIVPFAALFLAGLSSAQTAKPPVGEEKLTAAAEAARGALIAIESALPGLAEGDLIAYRGFFISADGLAVAPLQAFDGEQFKAARESDQGPVKIVGVVAADLDSGFAIVRTDQRPASFLPLAPTDLAVGERVAILRAEENGGTITAPVLARRKAPMARSLKYVDVLSIGANLGNQGGLHVPVGTPLFNASGQVVGCLSAPTITDRQRFLFAFPGSTFAARIPKSTAKLATIPFPLPASLQPADPLALDTAYLLGRRAQLLGENLEAERLLRKALARQPKSAAGWQRLGFVYRDLSRDDDAMQCFERAIAFGGNLGTFVLNQADQLLLKGHLDEATEVLQAACKATPFDADLQRACAMSFRLRKNEAAAEPLLRLATTLAPDSIHCWGLLSQCLAAQGKWDDEKIASDKIYELESLYRPR